MAMSWNDRTGTIEIRGDSSASASAPITGRAGTGVRSATIENCTAAALGLPPASRVAPAAMAPPSRCPRPRA